MISNVIDKLCSASKDLSPLLYVYPCGSNAWVWFWYEFVGVGPLATS